MSGGALLALRIVAASILGAVVVVSVRIVCRASGHIQAIHELRRKENARAEQHASLYKPVAKLEDLNEADSFNRRSAAAASGRLAMERTGGEPGCATGGGGGGAQGRRMIPLLSWSNVHSHPHTVPGAPPAALLATGATSLVTVTLNMGKRHAATPPAGAVAAPASAASGAEGGVGGTDDGGKHSEAVRRVYMLHTRQRAGGAKALEELLHEASQLRTLRHPGLLHIFAAVTELRSYGAAPFSEVALLSELAEASLATLLADNAHLAHHWAGECSAEQEGKAAARPNLLAASLGVGATDGLSWRGGLLAIATDVAQALAYLHRHGVAHGGLLLQDVMVTANWRAKLTEFGFVQLRGAKHANSATSPLETLQPGGSAAATATANAAASASALPASAVFFLPPERCRGPPSIAQDSGAGGDGARPAARRLRPARGAAERRTACTRVRNRSGAGGTAPAAVASTSAEAEQQQAGGVPLASVASVAEASTSEERATSASSASSTTSVAASAASVASVMAAAAQQGDAWSFGVLLCTLALHQHGQRETAEQHASLLFMGPAADAGPAGRSCRSSGGSDHNDGRARSHGSAGSGGTTGRCGARSSRAKGGRLTTRLNGRFSGRGSRDEPAELPPSPPADDPPPMPEQQPHQPHQQHSHHHGHHVLAHLGHGLAHAGHDLRHGLQALTNGRHHHYEPGAVVGGANRAPAGPSPYVLMLRLCQGTLSPLDGVGLANCPKPLLRLATACCEQEPGKRPALGHVAAELAGPILSLLDPDTLEARRPATPLRGWRAVLLAGLDEGDGGSGGGGDGVDGGSMSADANADGAAHADGDAHPKAIPECNEEGTWTRSDAADAKAGGAAEGEGGEGGGSRVGTREQPSRPAAAPRPQCCRQPRAQKNSLHTARPMPAPAPKDRTGVALSLFKRHDTNGDGVLDKEEVRSLAASLGTDLGDTELAEVMARLGGGASEVGVTYDEFLLLWAEGLSFAALRASDEQRAQQAAKREATRRSVVAAATAAAGTPPSAAAECGDGHGRRTLPSALTRQLSALHGFDEGVTKPVREGPGRLFSRARRSEAAAATTRARSVLRTVSEASDGGSSTRTTSEEAAPAAAPAAAAASGVAIEMQQMEA